MSGQNKMYNKRLNVNLIKSRVSGRYILSMDDDELKITCLALQQLADSEMIIETEEIISSEAKEYTSLMVEKLKSQRKSMDDNNADSKTRK